MDFPNYVHTPEGFINHVSQLQSADDVIDACAELLDYLYWYYQTTTISKYLTGYKKPLYELISHNSELNESVEIRHYCPEGEFTHTFKRGNKAKRIKAGDTLNFTLIQKQQHIAANLLSLDKAQLEELQRKEAAA